MFDDILRKITYGLYVVTTTTEKNGEIEKVGCTINSCMQITMEPFTIAISINKEHYTPKCIKEKKRFAVSVIGEDTPLIVIGTFGFFSSKEKDKFEEIEYEMTEDMPVIKSGLEYLVCDVINVIEDATHVIFIGKVIAGKMKSDGKPMTYAKYHEIMGK